MREYVVERLYTDYIPHAEKQQDKPLAPNFTVSLLPTPCLHCLGDEQLKNHAGTDSGLGCRIKGFRSALINVAITCTVFINHGCNTQLKILKLKPNHPMVKPKSNPEPQSPKPQTLKPKENNPQTPKTTKPRGSKMLWPPSSTLRPLGGSWPPEGVPCPRDRGASVHVCPEATKGPRVRGLRN